MKNIEEKIQNQKCNECKFCLWNGWKYFCSVKGCYENSKFIKFTLEGMLKDLQFNKK